MGLGMHDFNASQCSHMDTGPLPSFMASLDSPLVFDVKGNEEDLSGNSRVTGGTWGSDAASALNTALTAFAWTLLTEMQPALWSPALE